MRFRIIIIILFIASLNLPFLSGCGGGGGGGGAPRGTVSAPAAPTGVSAVVTGVGQVTISWTASQTATSYNIYYGTAAGTKTSGTKIPSITSTLFTQNSLTNGQTYYYVVTAVNSYGEGVPSNEVAAILQTPAPPANLTGVAGDKSVTLTWAPVQGAQSYTIYQSIVSGVSHTNYVTSASSTTSAYTAGSLTNGTNYYFVVTATNAYGESSESSEVSVTPSVTSGGITISGKVQYEDKQYNSAGFTGVTVYKAVRLASVELVDATSSGILGSGQTDANGNYSISLAAPTTASAYVRVESAAVPLAAAPTSTLEVRNLSNTLFGVPGSTFVPSGNASANISISTTNQAAGAFNIMDVYTSAYQFVNSLSPTPAPSLVAYWQLGNPNGTYYCTGLCVQGPGIYIVGGDDIYGSGDTDHYDDDVLLHEFGHFVADKFSRDHSPGGVHYLTVNNEDLRLSWSEGWGNFFQAAVKTWLSQANPSLLSNSGMTPAEYVDTTGSTVGIYFNFGVPTATGYPASDFLYSSSEVAVTKTLLGLMNNTSLAGMQSIWNVVSSYQDASTLGSPPTSWVNLELFWDRLLAQKSPNASDLTSLENIFAERSIFYKEDPYEPDNLVSAPVHTATIGVSEEHYLYNASGNHHDVDLIAFVPDPAKTCTIQTSNLRNGADTYIRILDSKGSSIGWWNDNASNITYTPCPNQVSGTSCNYDYYDFNSNYIYPLNNQTTLASKISGFSVLTPVGTPYYVEVSTSSNLPYSAGRYGTYTLTITQP